MQNFMTEAADGHQSAHRNLTDTEGKPLDMFASRNAFASPESASQSHGQSYGVQQMQNINTGSYLQQYMPSVSQLKDL